jgi:uncharacterized membrane-anchored protein
MKSLRSLIAVIACCAQFAWAAKPSKFKAPQWRKGPCVVGFGKVAKLNLPEGLRYLPASEVAKFYETPATADPAAQPILISSTDGDWALSARFVPEGHTKLDLDAFSLDKWHTDFEEHMKFEAHSSGVERVYLEVYWPVTPFLDKDADALGYAWSSSFKPYMTTNPNELMTRDLLFESLTKRMQAHFIKFGRRGNIVMAIHSGDPLSSDLEQCSSLIRGVTFADGERFKDYQSGDNASPTPLSALVQAPPSINLPVKVDLPESLTQDTHNLPAPEDLPPAEEQVKLAQAVDHPTGQKIDFSKATGSGMDASGCFWLLLKISPIALLGLGALMRRSNAEKVTIDESRLRMSFTPKPSPSGPVEKTIEQPLENTAEPPGEVEAMMGKAHQLFRSGQHTEANSIYLDVAQKFPDCKDAWLCLLHSTQADAETKERARQAVDRLEALKPKEYPAT